MIVKGASSLSSFTPPGSHQKAAVAPTPCSEDNDDPNNNKPCYVVLPPNSPVKKRQYLQANNNTNNNNNHNNADYFDPDERIRDMISDLSVGHHNNMTALSFGRPILSGTDDDNKNSSRQNNNNNNNKTSKHGRGASVLQTEKQVNAYVHLQLVCEDAVQRNLLDARFLDTSKSTKPSSASASVSSNDFLLRVLQWNHFQVQPALQMLQRMDWSSWNVTRLTQLQEQLHTHTLFPLPVALQLQSTKNKCNNNASPCCCWMYMKMSRYSPSGAPLSTLLANLWYVVQHFQNVTTTTTTSTAAASMNATASNNANNNHKKNSQKTHYNNKIGLIANLTDWSYERDFSMDYWKTFLDALSGKAGPVAAVATIFLVNPPPWFRKLWQGSSLKDTTATSISCIELITQDELHLYFAPGFAAYLPNEFVGVGQLAVPALVEQFIKVRHYMETELFPTTFNQDKDEETKVVLVEACPTQTRQMARPRFRRMASVSSSICSFSSHHHRSNNAMDFSDHSCYSKLSGDGNRPKMGRRASTSSFSLSSHSQQHPYSSDDDDDDGRPSYLMGTNHTTSATSISSPRRQAGKRPSIVSTSGSVYSTTEAATVTSRGSYNNNNSNNHDDLRSIKSMHENTPSSPRRNVAHSMTNEFKNRKRHLFDLMSHSNHETKASTNFAGKVTSGNSNNNKNNNKNSLLSTCSYHSPRKETWGSKNGRAVMRRICDIPSNIVTSTSPRRSSITKCFSKHNQQQRDKNPRAFDMNDLLLTNVDDDSSSSDDDEDSFGEDDGLII